MTASRVRKICADLGIRLIPTHVNRSPGAAKCGNVMTRIMQTRGEGHLILLLRTIMESEGNQLALVAPVLWALSDVMLANPRWPDRGLEWLEAFDAIDLCEIWARAKLANGAPPERHGIAMRLTELLLDRFPSIVEPPKPKREKQQAKPKPFASGARVIAIGLELDARKGPFSVSPVARDVCQKYRIDPARAGLYIRVARRYGERPEIYSVISAAALFALTRPSLPVDARDAFESRILAGEKIGQDEIDARAPSRKAVTKAPSADIHA